MTKFDDPDFVSYLESFSFITLCETFMETVELSQYFRDYECFVAPAKKLAQRGRRSGGVVCLLKREFSKYFQRLHCNYDNMIVFRVCKTLFENDKDVLLFNTYIPPSTSPYYGTSEFENGIDMLQCCITEILDIYQDCTIILNGDLNSRTGNMNAADESDVFDCRANVFDVSRRTQDEIVNEYGRLLLSLCIGYDLCILNGCICPDLSGKFTFVSATGSSVIDYFIVSKDFVTKCKQLKVNESVTSPHMCMELTIMGADQNSECTSEIRRVCTKIVWDCDSSALYIDNLSSNLEEVYISERVLEGDFDVHTLTDDISTCMVRAADFMTKTYVSGGITRYPKPWFDKQCSDSKRYVHKLLRRFLRTSSSDDRSEYVRNRNAYKKLISNKKSAYKQFLTCSLTNNVKDARKFWSQVRKLNSIQRMNISIAPEVWVDHFRDILGNSAYGAPKRSDSTLLGAPVVDTDDLNCAISEEEIETAIDYLKPNKAPGNDNIISEMMKCSKCMMLPYLTKLFNVIFDRGEFPRAWCDSVIIPLYKKGNRTSPDNYRGIALTSVLSKVFLHIVNDRINRWTEDKELILEEQAGFRKGYSTVDNIFVLYNVIEKYLNRHRKLYVAFIDFKKAFDSVDREELWPVLRRYGITGKL